MFLSAGVHGDEINGIAVVKRFTESLDLSRLRGCLIILPIVNVTGYEARVREVPEDGKDLNRCMPGKAHGSLAERIAHAIFSEILPSADLGLDVHDSGRGSVLLPHARVHDDQLLEMASALGMEVIMRATLPPGYHGILSLEARKCFARPFLHVEIGGQDSLWPVLIETGVRGLRNLLAYSGMLPGSIELPRRQFVLAGRDDMAQRAPISGLLTQLVGLGEFVATGQALATVEDVLMMRRVVMSAPHCGVVHDLNLRGTVNRGDDVVGVLEIPKCDHTGKPILDGPSVRVNHADSKFRIRATSTLLRQKAGGGCLPPLRGTQRNVTFGVRVSGRSWIEPS